MSECKHCGMESEHCHYCCDGSHLDLLKKENAAQKNQLTELAEAAENMLTLLVDNKPIDGLWLSNIEEWDCLIKEVIK